MMVFMVRGKRARETSDNKKIIHSVVNKPSCKNEDNKKVTIDQTDRYEVIPVT